MRVCPTPFANTKLDDLHPINATESLIIPAALVQGSWATLTILSLISGYVSTNLSKKGFFSSAHNSLKAYVTIGVVNQGCSSGSIMNGQTGSSKAIPCCHAIKSTNA